MRWIAGLAFIFLINVSAHASDSDWVRTEWEQYRTYLAEPTCGETADYDKCNKALLTWRRDFFCAFDPKEKKRLACIRNVAFCLLSSCNAEIRVSRLLACAWHEVLISTGDPKLNGTDIDWHAKACGSLSDTELAAAKAQANRLQSYINAPAQKNTPG